MQILTDNFIRAHIVSQFFRYISCKPVNLPSSFLSFSMYLSLSLLLVKEESIHGPRARMRTMREFRESCPPGEPKSSRDAASAANYAEAIDRRCRRLMINDATSVVRGQGLNRIARSTALLTLTDPSWPRIPTGVARANGSDKRHWTLGFTSIETQAGCKSGCVFIVGVFLGRSCVQRSPRTARGRWL